MPTITTKPTQATEHTRNNHSETIKEDSNLKISEEETKVEQPDEENDDDQYTSIGDEAIQSTSYDRKAASSFQANRSSETNPNNPALQVQVQQVPVPRASNVPTHNIH